MRSKTLINNETAAISYDSVGSTSFAPTTLAASGLGDGEVISLQININGTFVDVYEDGFRVELTSTNNVVPLRASGVYKINKGVTVAGVTVQSYKRFF